MQLVAYGAQDVYLTGNPQISFFKTVYRRHTNFSIEPIEIPFDSAHFGSRNTIQVLRNGDLATRVFVKVTLPKLQTVDPNHKIAWTRFIGHAVMNNIEITIGGTQIDKHYSIWVNMWISLIHHNEVASGYDCMVGNIPKLTILNTYIPEYTLYIPLEFWFNRNKGLALPLIALQYHEVRFNIEFTKFEDLVNYQGGSISQCLGISNYQNMNFIDSSILIEYIYLDQEERRRMAQVGHEYLIEQVQFNGSQSISSANNRIKLDFNHPSKELFWSIQSSLFIKHKRFITYFSGGNIFNPIEKAIAATLDYANKNLAIGLFVTGLQPSNKNDANWVSPTELVGTFDRSGVPAQSIGIINFIIPTNNNNLCECPCPNIQNSILVTANIINDSHDIWRGQNLWINAGLSFGTIKSDLAHKLKEIKMNININSIGDVTFNNINIIKSNLNIADASIPVDKVIDNRSLHSKKLDVFMNQPFNYGADLIGSGIMVSVAKIQFNGQDRFDEQPGEYFNYVQPWECHTHTPDDGIYIYSFAMHPEKYQPSGSANLSRIDSTDLYLQLTDPFRPINTSPYSTSYAYGTYNLPDCQQYRSIPVEVIKDSLLWVFDFNYNVLRVMSGMAGLAYSN